MDFVGRIKTTLLKTITKDLMDKHGDKLSTDFEQNKVIVTEHLSVSSKKQRNIIGTRNVKEFTNICKDDEK